MNYENMLTLKDRISGFDAGSLLDVGVGRGEFLKFALGSFHSWKKAAGIDIDQESLQTAINVFDNTPVILVVGSALSMPFSDKYFDTVTLSNALHHIENLPVLLSEIVRVCKSKGRVIINEMINENITGLQETYMLYHRFIADIDNHRGVYHRETYTLKEIQSITKIHDFQLLDCFVHAEVAGDAMDSAEIDAISDRLNKKVQQLRGSDYYYFYENKAREIINHFIKTGIHRPRHVTLILQVL